MKISKFLLAPLAFGIIASPAIAGKKDIPNGQPFKALEAMIEANQALIEANSGSIDALNAQIAALSVELASTQQDLALLSGRVDTNESNIADLLTQVADNTADIATLETELANAVAETNQLRADLEAQLAQLDTDLRGLVSTNTGLIAQLNSLITSLQSQVDSNTSAIDPLSTQIAGLLVTVMANTNTITQLQADRSLLDTQISDLNDSISLVFTQIENLKSRVSNLESFHADLFVGSSLSGSLESSDERSQVRTCSVNTGGGRGVSQNCYADFYTLYIAEETTVTINLGSPDLNTANYGSGNFYDTYLILHNDGELDTYIGIDDDRGYRLNSQITATLQPGTYVVEVTAYSIYNDGLNDYQLTVE